MDIEVVGKLLEIVRRRPSEDAGVLCRSCCDGFVLETTYDRWCLAGKDFPGDDPIAVKKETLKLYFTLAADSNAMEKRLLEIELGSSIQVNAYLRSENLQGVWCTELTPYKLSGDAIGGTIEYGWSKLPQISQNNTSKSSIREPIQKPQDENINQVANDDNHSNKATTDHRFGSKKKAWDSKETKR